LGFRVLQKQIERLVRSSSDLSVRQLHVLFQLLANGDMTVKDLSKSGGDHFDKPAVSRAVTRLKDLGYLDRQEHPADRRLVLVSLTRLGKEFVQEATKD
jgi:DNA-binding MarR family transcriptional regulator